MRSEVEREHAGDRDRWHREGAARQEAAVMAAAKAAGANTADVVARRALLENELMAAEVAYQSRQARTLGQKQRSVHPSSWPLSWSARAARCALPYPTLPYPTLLTTLPWYPTSPCCWCAHQRTA